MRSRLLAAAVAAVALSAGLAEAGGPVMWPLYRAQKYNWHANYTHQQYSAPVAMVVPPTAQMQTQYGWGVSSSRVGRLDHQFGRNFPGGGPFGGPFQSVPLWPQDTTQFGVYHVRGPW